MIFSHNQANAYRSKRSRKPVEASPRIPERTRLGLFIICALAVNITNGMGEEESPKSRHLIHATYAVGDRLLNKTQIEKTHFSAFDYIYLMAGPTWEAQDFDGTNVMRLLVTEHAYPDGDKGACLVPMFLKHAHDAGTRVLLSLPGQKKFRLISESPEKRRLFTEVMVAFVKKYNYDGIEIDWKGADLRLDIHAQLMKDPRIALDAPSAKSRSYTLTTALHTYHKITESIAAEWCRSLDWINLMSYDLGGGTWGRTASHNTPLTVIKDHTERYYEKQVFPGNGA